MEKPNLFLIGPGRTATTSLFRMLIKHPQICGSRKKEADRYRNIIFNESLSDLEKYLELFKHCGGEKIIIDATPGYFFGGSRVASTIKQEMGIVKVIIILRDPMERTYSLYKHVRNKQGLSLNEDFETYLNICASYSKLSNYDNENIRYSCLEEGKYGCLISEWYEVMGMDNVLLINFDEIESRSKNVLDELVKFLKITSDNDFYFLHENKSIKPKNKQIHKLILMLNNWFEPVLNNYPIFRIKIRNIYYFLNGRHRDNKRDLENFFPFFKNYYYNDFQELKKLCDIKGIKIFWLDKYL